jgi:hypothetical protein
MTVSPSLPMEGIASSLGQQQVARSMIELRGQPSDLDRYCFLRRLQA